MSDVPMTASITQRHFWWIALSRCDCWGKIKVTSWDELQSPVSARRLRRHCYRAAAAAAAAAASVQWWDGIDASTQRSRWWLAVAVVITLTGTCDRRQHQQQQQLYWRWWWRRRLWRQTIMITMTTTWRQLWPGWQNDKLPAMTAMMMTMTMITVVSTDTSKAYDVNRRQHH